MNPAGKEEEIFESARHIQDAAQRRVHLENACGGDAVLYERVEALLSAYSEADSFLSEFTGGDHPTGEAK